MNQWPLATTPKQKQLEVFERSCDEPGYAFFMEMGVGKTVVALATAAHLYEKQQIDLLVVVAPKGVYRNWPNREVPKHWPDRLGAKVVVWPKLLEPREERGLEMVFINVEALSSSAKAVDFIKAKIKGRKALLCLDESSGLKNSKSNRSMVCKKLGQACRYRRILTGSPVTQAPLDVWSQLACLHLPHDVWPYTSFLHFKARYAVQQQVRFGHRSFNKIVGYRHLEELQEKLGKFSARVLKSECLDLPEKIYMPPVEVELTPEQVKAYNDMAEQGYHALEADIAAGRTIAASHAMVALQKMRQICCGHIGDPEEKTVHSLPHRRLEALYDVIEEMQGPVVIWSSWRYSIREIVAGLREKYGPEAVAEYWGGVSDKTCEADLELFLNGTARFFVGNPQKGGYGLTLTNAKNMIYYNNSFSLEERLQSEDRCHRFGQTQAVTYVDLVCPGTVDMNILEALYRKQELASKTLGDEFRGWFKAAGKTG